jgi:hypothetical protein
VVRSQRSEEVGARVPALTEIRRGIELNRRRNPEQALDRRFSETQARFADRVLT